MNKHGRIECLNVCDNYSDHLVGNVYIKFASEQSALDAMTALQNRFYNGKPILAEFSPVADFREATCRQYEENSCQRGGYCNFMHLKPISRCDPAFEKSVTAFTTPLCAALSALQPAASQPRAAPCRDLKKHLFGRYQKEKRAAAAASADRRGRRSRSPVAAVVRESSVERRERIAEWTRKRKEAAAAGAAP